jgi:HupE/UreJ protein
MPRVMRVMNAISVSNRRVGRRPVRVGGSGATRTAAFSIATGLVLAVAFGTVLDAHGVSGKDAVFLQGLQGRAVIPLMYLGAKHMVTGYDHLLFLVGVIFFLYRLKDVLLYVSLFTIGHSVTLLLGVLGGIHANPYIIDAIIGFSVVYKAFENMDGFRRVFGFQPNTRAAVLVFGLFHGFGLATKLQDFDLAPQGLVANIISFNVGVELGQGLALTFILIALTYWRTRSGFLHHAFATNAIVMACGLLLVGYQLSGYFLAA